jgi:hypothetical protein
MNDSKHKFLHSIFLYGLRGLVAGVTSIAVLK